MSKIETGAMMPTEVARFNRRAVDLPGELVVGTSSLSCRIRMISAAGAEVELPEGGATAEGLAPDVVISIPSIGQYRARRGWRQGRRAAYLFELSEFSLRALDALLADRCAPDARPD